MNRLRLRHIVTISGRGFNNAPARVTLEPIDETDGLHGWEWFANGKSIPLEAHHLRIAGDELALCHNGATLNYAMHLLALRSLIGLDAVRIRTDGPIPFCTSALLFLESVRPVSEICGELTPFSLPALEVESKPSKMQLIPGSRPLSVHAFLSLGLGRANAKYHYVSDNPVLVDNVARAPIPHPLRHIKLMQLMERVPKKMRQRMRCWQTHLQASDVLVTKQAVHRILDLLGALCTATPPGRVLHGRVLASQADAKTDLLFVQQIEKRKTAHAETARTVEQTSKTESP